MKSPHPHKRRVALKLFLLLIICLAPMIGALFLYQARDNFEFMSKNQGTLILPSVNLEALGVNTPEPRRWLLAYYTPNGCNMRCQEVLAHFSVIEQSLIKDKPRIGSVLLSPNAVIAGTLPTEPSDLLEFQTNHNLLPKQLMPFGQDTGIWLIDPLGNIILRYELDALDNRMLLDLRYLLKVSQIG
jgi:hypothetical protein